MNESSKKNGRRTLILISLLALLGVGGGAGVRLYLASQAGGGFPGSGAGTAASSPFKGAGLSSKAAAMWTRLLAGLALQGSQRFTIARLVELLKGHGDSAAAKAFAAAFERDPELRSIWHEYLHSRDTRDAAWLAQKLSQSQSFVELLNRCADDDGCLRVSDSLAREVSGATIESGLARVTGAGDLELGAGASNGGRGARGRENWRSLEGNAEAVAALRRSAAYHAGGKGSGSFDTVEFKRIHGAGNSFALAGLASLFSKMDKDTRDRVLENLDDQGDVWKACARAEATSSCKSAVQNCKGDAECRKYLVVVGPPPVEPQPQDPRDDLPAPLPPVWSGGGGDGPKPPNEKPEEPKPPVTSSTPPADPGASTPGGPPTVSVPPIGGGDHGGGPQGTNPPSNPTYGGKPKPPPPPPPDGGIMGPPPGPGPETPPRPPRPGEWGGPLGDDGHPGAVNNLQGQ